MSMNTPNAKIGKKLKIKNRKSKELIPYISMKKEHTLVPRLEEQKDRIICRETRQSKRQRLERSSYYSLICSPYNQYSLRRWGTSNP